MEEGLRDEISYIGKKKERMEGSHRGIDAKKKCFLRR